MKKAFSLIEISIVILIIGILFAGVTQGSRMVQKSRLNGAQALTQGSPVNGIKDLALWFETTGGASFATSLSNNDPLAAASGAAAWLDINPQLMTKNHALSTSNSPYASNPTYVESELNGLPALKFNGTSQFLDFTNPNVLTNSSYAIFVVEKPTRTSGTRNYFIAPKSGSCSANRCFNFGHENLTGPYIIYMSHLSNWLSTTSTEIPGLTYKTNSPIIHSGIFAIGGARKYFYNGVLGDSDTGVAALISNNLMSIGNASGFSGGFYQGLIGEIIIFTRSLTKEERWEVEKYLGKKWGVAVSQQG